MPAVRQIPLEAFPANERPDIVGVDEFNYADGAVSALSGGELFDYDNVTDNDAYVGHTGASSSWEVLWNTPVMSNGMLYVWDSPVYRSLNGSEAGGEDLSLFGPASEYAEVDSEVLYAKWEMTLLDGASWGGLSFYAAGTEEIYFGSGGDAPYRFAIRELDSEASFSDIYVTNGTTYTIVAKIDGTTGSASLWIDPDLGAAETGADVERAFTYTSGLCGDAIRLASNAAAFDNIVIGKTWASLSATEIGSGEVSEFSISTIQFSSGDTELQLGLTGLDVGTTYKIQTGDTPASDSFTDVAGSEFVAESTDDTVTVSVGSEEVLFFRAVAP